MNAATEANETTQVRAMALKILIGFLRIGRSADIVRSIPRWSPGFGLTQAMVQNDRQEIVKKWLVPVSSAPRTRTGQAETNPVARSRSIEPRSGSRLRTWPSP